MCTYVRHAATKGFLRVDSITRSCIKLALIAEPANGVRGETSVYMPRNMIDPLGFMSLGESRRAIEYLAGVYERRFGFARDG